MRRPSRAASALALALGLCACSTDPAAAQSPVEDAAGEASTESVEPTAALPSDSAGEIHDKRATVRRLRLIGVTLLPLGVAAVVGGGIMASKQDPLVRGLGYFTIGTAAPMTLAGVMLLLYSAQRAADVRRLERSGRARLIIGPPARGDGLVALARLRF